VAEAVGPEERVRQLTPRLCVLGDCKCVAVLVVRGLARPLGVETYVYCCLDSSTSTLLAARQASRLGLETVRRGDGDLELPAASTIHLSRESAPNLASGLLCACAERYPKPYTYTLNQKP